MSERRYNEAEAAAIFERATETPATGTPHAGSGEGMTLAQLQEIGREVGISSEAIALAAQSVDQAPPPPPRTVLGLPLGVARTVNLGRLLTDEEWERIVVDLRETFDARGVVKSHGSFRQWTNGNLQALLEPTETGHRLRLRTVKGNALPMMAAGVGMAGFSAVWSIALAMQGALAEAGALLNMGLLGLGGAGLFAASAFRLPGWARTRARQMEEIAARVARLASATATDKLPPGPRVRDA